MRQFTYLFILCLSLIIGFTNCEETALNKDTSTNIENTPTNWAEALQNATSFKEETALLSTLIQIDSTNTHQLLIANRLQTFDLRHLSETEKLTIINLYAASLVPTRQPSSTVLQIAQAKLNAVYPTDQELVNKRIMEIMEMIAASQ